MTTQISFPAKFDNLSDDDQKLAKELMKSILQAEEATDILLDLLGSKELDSDLPKFRENCKKHLDNKFNLGTANLATISALPMNSTGASDDHVPPPPPPAPIAAIPMVQFIVERAKAIQDRTKNRCKQICQHDSTSKECIDCQRILGQQ
ncbi:hypothetical protein H6F32_04825 [Anabaena sp. FACHB-1237]|uniref:hypothetical protein n=1 Tax=Anabaena sp. FACHB-1237 TaxID=2692769 RepID=UPI001680A36B|nr:hypothetical protein [Anabaena sp. FACHB-1237]MBD2136925.1 hypothetical protein [Anabaena sp. FACHB-1237]